MPALSGATEAMRYAENVQRGMMRPYEILVTTLLILVERLLCTHIRKGSEATAFKGACCSSFLTTGHTVNRPKDGVPDVAVLELRNVAVWRGNFHRWRRNSILPTEVFCDKFAVSTLQPAAR